MERVRKDFFREVETETGESIAQLLVCSGTLTRCVEKREESEGTSEQGGFMCRVFRVVRTDLGTGNGYHGQTKDLSRPWVLSGVLVRYARERQ